MEIRDRIKLSDVEPSEEDSVPVRPGEFRDDPSQSRRSGRRWSSPGSGRSGDSESALDESA